MGIMDRVRAAIGVLIGKEEVKKAEAVTFDLNPIERYTRPVGGYVQMGISDIVRVPYIPLGFRFCYDLYYYSDVLRTIIRSLVQETFRNGLHVTEKYKYKCTRCGAEYMDPVERCEICGNEDFERPSQLRRVWLEKWIQNVNLNGQSLLEVLEEVSYDLNILDNAFLVVRKKYLYDDKGELVGEEVVEVLRGDPLKLRLVISKDGRPGRTDDGRLVVACPEHRSEYHVVSDEEYMNGKDKCPKCGRKMLPVVAMLKKGGENVAYLLGEVLHIKKFTHGIGYGFPPVMTVWIKVMTLMKMDYFVLMSYHLQRPPRGLLIIRARREDVAKAWQWLMEQSRLNPHMIYPLVIPPEVGNTRRVAEWLDLSVKKDDITFGAYRDECRRQIGAVWGVMPIFQGDMSTGRGLANQGLQLTVTNRAIEREHRIWNDKVLPWLMKQLGIDDWIIQLKPHEEKDLMAQLEREMARVDLADRLTRMGYDVEIVEGADGIEFKILGRDYESVLRNYVENILRNKGIRSKKVIEEKVQQIMQILGVKSEEEPKRQAGRGGAGLEALPPAGAEALPPTPEGTAPPGGGEVGGGEAGGTEVATGEVSEEVRQAVLKKMDETLERFNTIRHRVDRMWERATRGYKQDYYEDKQWARESHEGEVKDKKPRKHRQRFEGEVTGRRGGKEEKYFSGARYIEDLKEGEEQ